MDQTLTIASAQSRWQLRATGRTIGLLALSVALLTLAFPPACQFYLAWIGLAPWLLVVHRSRSATTAFAWSWLAGTCFFAANMWWMAAISAAGMAALMIYCGVYWGLAALLIRGSRLLDAPPTLAVLGVAAIWVASEFVRGNLMTGLAWLFISHSQTPFLAMCQIADITGAYGVSFWLVMINALLALLLIRRAYKPLAPAILTTLIVLAGSLVYGQWRINQSATLPGPKVLVVQANYPQSNRGEKGATDEELLKFHVDATTKSLSNGQNANLIAWSETMMPPLNRASLIEFTQNWPCHYGQIILSATEQLSMLAIHTHAGVLVGGRYWNNFKMTQREDKVIPYPSDSRNSAYLFQPDGSMSDLPGDRYDKIHLVPFGEFIPFKNSIPFLYKLFLALGPNYYSDYEIQDGSDNGLTVFKLEDADGQPRWRFVTPICFEDVDPRLCAAMFRPGSDGQKRADFMVNVTNDGWFAAGENMQHLQAAIFRCIENRAPMARSVNTGISGFIDSTGQTSGLIAARTEGTSLMQLRLDGRLSFYTRHGDLFAWLCTAAAAVIGAGGILSSSRKKVIGHA